MGKIYERAGISENRKPEWLTNIKNCLTSLVLKYANLKQLFHIQEVNKRFKI